MNKKLFLTSALVLMSINTDVFANGEPDFFDETLKGPAVRALPTSRITESGVGTADKDEAGQKAEGMFLKSHPVSPSKSGDSSLGEEVQVDFPPINGQVTPTSGDIEIPAENLFLPGALGKIGVAYRDKEFYITKDNVTSQVQRCDLSQELRGMPEDNLKAFLKAGYLSVKKLDDEYGIDARYRLRGGGPISGAIAYWATKTFCYGTAVAATGAAVVATGGVAGAALGATSAAATLGASAGATVVGGAIAGAGGTALAAEVTVAAITGPAGIAGAVAAVESASLGMGALFTAIPFLP